MRLSTDPPRFARQALRYTPFVIMGLVELLSQTLLLRELLVLFEGNELTIGIVLASWMSLAALGAFLGGRIGRVSVHSGRMFAVALAANGLLLPLGIIAARTARVWAGIPLGITLSYGTALWITIVILLPFGLLAGAQFSFACRYQTGRMPKPDSQSCVVYELEAIGFLVGGFVFSLVLASGLQPIRVAVTVAAISLASCLLILARGSPEFNRPRFRLGVTVMLILLACIAASPLPQIIKMSTTQLAARHLDVQDVVNSRYSNLVLTEEEGGQISVFLNGLFATSSPQADAAVVDPLIRFPLLLHEHPTSLLSLGTGLELLIKAAADAHIEDPHYVELDPILLHVLSQLWDATQSPDLETHQATLHAVDIRSYLASSGPHFDVILLHPPAPTSIQMNRLYTWEFFALCSRRMNEDGILAITIPSSDIYLSEDLARLNKSIYRALSDVFSAVLPLPGTPAILLASNRPEGLVYDSVELSLRLTNSGLETSLFNARYLELRTRSRLQTWYLDSLQRVADTPINRDTAPSALRFALILRTSETSPGWARFLRAVEHPLPWLGLLAALVGIPSLLLAFRSVGGTQREFVVTGNAVLTNGMIGTTTTAILVLLFQAKFGSVYSAIALLTASFMGGLALGAIVIRRTRSNWQTVGQFEILSLAVPGTLLALIGFGNTHLMSTVLIFYEATFFLAAAACGFLVGGQFAVVLKLCWSKRAFSIYALDLLGAALAAVVVTAFVIPTFGVGWTLTGLAILKGGSLLMLKLSGRQ